MNSKLHTVVDQDGKPLCLLLSEGEMSDYKGAALLLPVLLEAQELITDKGIDTVWFRQALFDRKIKLCISPRKGRTANIFFDKATYKLRHKIENLFAKLQTWRRIARRYDQCAHNFFLAICIAAAVIFYLN